MKMTQCLALAALLATPSLSLAAFSYVGLPLSEPFNGMATSGTTVLTGTATVGAPVAIPGSIFDGAHIGGSGTTISLIADTGTTNSGALFNYGAAASTDRALGLLASGTQIGAFGLAVTNNFANTRITSVIVSFYQENWRSSTSAVNTMTASYGTSDTIAAVDVPTYLAPLSSGFTTVSDLSLVGPAAVATNGALDGNAAANRTLRTAVISGLDLIPGEKFFIRWSDANDAGNDAGLAVDDFAMSFTTSSIVVANVPPTVVITPSNSITVDVSPPGLESFSGTTVTAADSDGTISSFSFGAIPAQIADNIAIVPGAVPNTFDVSGSGFTYDDAGTYQITFTANDGTDSTSQILTISVVPEPTTLAGLAMTSLILVRRRK